MNAHRREAATPESRASDPAEPPNAFLSDVLVWGLAMLFSFAWAVLVVSFGALVF
jgi:hypothetical protein